ncbi:MAG: SpoIIE family protein phosphatase [Planctomycetota bacterium]
MAVTKLIISGPEGTRHIPLDPNGVTLGRDPSCAIILDHGTISRLHARIYQDPFGRWIIEDLDSQNGVFIESQRIKAHAVLPDQKINIHPFNLSLRQDLGQQTSTDWQGEGSASLVDKGLEEELVAYESGKDVILSATLIHYLNEMTTRLLKLQSPSELYPEACYDLARFFDGLVAFVRLPPSPDPLPGAPQILACCFGRETIKAQTPTTYNIHLSERVLNAVRSTRNAVMARTGPSCDMQMGLTVGDQTNPHIVYSAPIGDLDEGTDALYLEVLESHLPKEMFDFVQAVARQIDFARSSLLFSEAKAKRRILDQQLSLARDIQARLTPQALEDRFAVDLAVCYQPAMWVGGDYCDVWSLPDGQIAFTVGDVSGKGLPAAMVMSNLQAALRTTMTFCSQLSAVAEHVNRHLCQNLRDDMFVTLFLGLFDPSRNELKYVNAGHIQPLIGPPSGPARRLAEPANPPLGILEGTFDTIVEAIDPDAGLLVVTDGITEARSQAGGLFEAGRLEKLMEDCEFRSAQHLVDTVTKAVADFRRSLPQQDDITVFALVNRKTG